MRPVRAAARSPRCSRWRSARCRFAALSALGTWQVHAAALEARADRARRAARACRARAGARPRALAAGHRRVRRIPPRARRRHLPARLARPWSRPSPSSAAGYWVLTPLRDADGSDRADQPRLHAAERGDRCSARAAHRRAPPHGEVATVTGLLRISEPGGGFLRRNDPGADRWYSRDVQAIAAARGLRRRRALLHRCRCGDQRTAARRPAPVGGLTVIAFHNNHLVYALTWYALALMVAGAACCGSRASAAAAPWRRRRPGDDGEDDDGMAQLKRASERMTASWPAARVENAAGHKNMLQLIQLRWIAVVGQITTIAVVHARASASTCRCRRCSRCWPA